MADRDSIEIRIRHVLVRSQQHVQTRDYSGVSRRPHDSGGVPSSQCRLVLGLLRRPDEGHPFLCLRDPGLVDAVVAVGAWRIARRLS